MDPTILERMRGRRGRAMSSQENLIKDSSSTSDVSPRSNVNENYPPQPLRPGRRENRRQRRAQRPSNELVNQAFQAEEYQQPQQLSFRSPIEERQNSDDEIEKDIKHADKLVTDVSKQHRRTVKELRSQRKQSQTDEDRDGREDDVDDNQKHLKDQIKEQQEILSRKTDASDRDENDIVEPLKTNFRDRSIDQIIESARRSVVKTPDDDLTSRPSSTMGSARRGESTLQKILNRRDVRLDRDQVTTLGDTTTIGQHGSRFDYAHSISTSFDEERQRQIRDKQQTRWQKTAKLALANSLIPPPSEQEDFFMKVWTDNEVVQDKQQADISALVTTAPTTTADIVSADGTPQIKPPEIEQNITPKEDDTQPLLPQPVFGELQPLLYQKAEPISTDEQRDHENKIFKYVIGGQLSLEEKLGAGIVHPRLLEDEGIYVGKKPVVPTNSVLRTEKRILQEKNLENKPAQRWFGPDGQIVSLPDPTKFVPTRPLVDETFDAAISKEFHKAYVMDDVTPVSQTGIERYRLDIDIGSIAFTHHHLFSVEHVLAMKLKQMYHHYVIRKQQRLVDLLSEKIKALKNAETNCRTILEQNRYSENALPNEVNRLKNYQNELRQARNQRCSEMKLDRQLLEKMLDTWRKIKDIRIARGYTTTPVKLIIKQLSGKRAKHSEVIQQQIEDEIADEITLAREKYKFEEKEYNKIVKKRKLQSIRKKEAQKRLEKKARTTVEYDQTDTNDLAIVNEEDIPPRSKPVAREDDEIRTIVLDKYKNTVRPPDEPEVLLELVYSEPVTNDLNCSANEQQRRRQLQFSSDIFVRILINNKVIANTTNISLTNEFEGKISQIFPCYIVRIPDTIKIEIYENRLRSLLLAEVYLPIPEATITSENYKLEGIEFSSNTLIRTNNAGVGAGVPSPYIDVIDRPNLYLEGILNAAVAWGVQDGDVLVPAGYTKSQDPFRRQKDVNINDPKSLIEWINKSNLDPYDPDNAFFLNLVKDYMGLDIRSSSLSDFNTLQHYRLNQETGIELIDDQEIDNSLRFKLLQLRKENIPDFKDCKNIPPYDYLVRIQDTAFKNYINRRKEIIESEQEQRFNRIDAVRKHGEKNLRKIREQILARLNLSRYRKSFQDMVIEESVPNIGALSGALQRLYIEPRRPLYPTRKEKKKIAGFTLVGREVYILINIIGAIDLPIRRDVIDREKTKRTKVNERVSLVRPYIEINFQNKIYRTSTVDGPNGSWNEELRVPFRPPDNDFTSTSLQRCRDIIYINVFDEVEVNLPIIEREREQTIHKRISRNWLGSIRIPFANVYINSRLEGTYIVNVPSPLLGYTRDRGSSQARFYSNANLDVPLNPSLLRMFITMEPQLIPPETLVQTLDSTESFELLNHAREWVQELITAFPDRDYKATVSDITGRAVFITRFLHPLTPPPLSIDDSLPPQVAASTTAAPLAANEDRSNIQSQRVARFVSMIPFLSDSIAFPGICDIWETSAQFLQTMAGDDEEHAVLLNNYFTSLNKRAWIALGKSIYSGPCCFVLTQEGDRKFSCWSVSDGVGVSTRDTWNQIQNIYLLANEENIWANIQVTDTPARMDFDLTQRKNWRPFFDNSFPKPATFDTIQPTDLHYEATRSEDVDFIQKTIQETLRNKIIEWREPHVTRWHWLCQKKLQELIKRKELFIVRNTMQEVDQELTEFQNTHNISGFPLQMPYTSIQAILDAVQSTKIFEHPTNEIEFCLAVHIHAYPNNILAVWIYIANLTRKIT